MRTKNSTFPGTNSLLVFDILQYFTFARDAFAIQEKQCDVSTQTAIHEICWKRFQIWLNFLALCQLWTQRGPLHIL